MSHACDSCGKPATCVGQFAGSCTPTYACDSCCDHVEDEDGECEPLEPSLDEAVDRLRSMATRPLPPIPKYDREAAMQIELATQYQSDLRLVLAELDRLHAKEKH